MSLFTAEENTLIYFILKTFLCLDMFCWIARSINFDLLFQQDAYKTGKLCTVNLIKLACFCYKAKIIAELEKA